MASGPLHGLGRGPERGICAGFRGPLCAPAPCPSPGRLHQEPLQGCFSATPPTWESSPPGTPSGSVPGVSFFSKPSPWCDPREPPGPARAEAEVGWSLSPARCFQGLLWRDRQLLTCRCRGAALSWAFWPPCGVPGTRLTWPHSAELRWRAVDDHDGVAGGTQGPAGSTL